MPWSFYLVIKWIFFPKVHIRKEKKKKYFEKFMISGCCNTKVFSLLNLGYSSFSEKRQDPCDGKLKHKKQIDKKMIF